MTTVAEEEQREVELDRLYFGRARDRQFEGLGSAQKPGTSAGASKQNKKKTRGKGKAATTQDDEKAAGGDGWEGSFFFLQLADTQLGFYNDNQVFFCIIYLFIVLLGFIFICFMQSWDKEIALATRAVRCINAMRPRPRFVVVCGDLVHAYPWEKPAYDRQVLTPLPLCIIGALAGSTALTHSPDLGARFQAGDAQDRPVDTTRVPVRQSRCGARSFIMPHGLPCNAYHLTRTALRWMHRRGEHANTGHHLQLQGAVRG
jgi:hypothetical protein